MSVEALTEPFVVTEPGIYEIPEADYHLDPVPGGSLSSSTAKRLLAPSCPAIAKYESDHPVFKDAWDLGSGTHKKILGAGGELVEVEAKTWSGKAAAERLEVRARGGVALLSHQMRQAEAMAKAVHAHPLAAALLNPDLGQAEQCVFWRDKGTGIWRRSMLDYLSLGHGRPIIADVKSTNDPSPAAIAKSIYNYGYFIQDPFYREAVESLGHEDPLFYFIFVGKDAPHLVTVVELDEAAVNAGRRRIRQAIQIWQDCRESGVWPAYSTEIELIGLPRWAAKLEEDN